MTAVESHISDHDGNDIVPDQDRNTDIDKLTPSVAPGRRAIDWILKWTLTLNVDLLLQGPLPNAVTRQMNH